MRIKHELWKGADRICWLCVLMEEFIGTNSLAEAPVVMSGMASILNAPLLKQARQAIFNMRQMSLTYVTEQSVKHAVVIYNDHHYCNKTQGTYEIDAQTLRFKRTDPLEDPLITEARKILSVSMPYKSHGIQVADPRRLMLVSLGQDTAAYRIPINPITTSIAPRRIHSFNRKPRGKICISLKELHDLAVEMDERESKNPEHRPGHWVNRFDNFDLMMPVVGKGLQKKNELELEDIKHLIGLTGAGKTTLLVLLAIWLGRNGYKAMFLFPSIEVARQYMTQLAFHEVKVGMLVGQSDETRRHHADNIAEAIAASGSNRGFAYTLPEAEVFSLNCVLPAFSNDDTSMWGFGYAPCKEILQNGAKKGQMRKSLCPLWTMCGRNKAPRDLIDADVWVGHVLSLDTKVSPHAIQEQICYFELIARTFDAVVFDEADMVQSVLDAHGAATLSISGSDTSIHTQILEQIHNRIARGENHRLSDRDVELYSRNLAEFGNHNTSMMSAILNMDKTSRVGERYENQLLTVLRIVSDLLDGFDKFSKRDELDNLEVQLGFSKSQALTEVWERAASIAFYYRTNVQELELAKADSCARVLKINRSVLVSQWKTLINHFRRYLAEDSIKQRDKIIEEISELFLPLCFPKPSSPPREASDVITLLISVTFVILGYQRIVPGTRAMVAEGLIREPIVKPNASSELRKIIPENILGSFSGVKYSFSKAMTTRTKARNVKLWYVKFIGAPRMLMHSFHKLLEVDGEKSGPAILMTSATSFLKPSPAYHIDAEPNYLLKPRQLKQNPLSSVYRFKWIPDHEYGGEPLRYSGAGQFQERNLLRMVDALVKGGKKSEIYKSIQYFDKKDGICRKAALIVNSYEQARTIKQYLNDYHREVGKRTKAVVRSLKPGERPTDFVTTAQCESLGDDETCDILIFPMLAIGRGVNIVFTKGARKLDAAIGSIYFLTRPHPSTDDMQLLYSLAGRLTQEFDSRVFTTKENLGAIANSWKQARKDLWRYANRLLGEPLMASRLGSELFEPFTANQMVAILQTIGRGMRNGCPVAVYFVDAAWAPRSTQEKPDSIRGSMLVQMRSILEECVSHPDEVIREIYQELYGAFLEPLRQIEGVEFPNNLHAEKELGLEEDFDEFSPLLEM